MEQQCFSSLENQKRQLLIFHKILSKSYYQNEPRFSGVFSTNNLPKKIKDGAYVINLDDYADVGTHWIALFCNRNEIAYFDSFGV